MIQQTEQWRSSVTGGDAGCPTHHQSYKTKQKSRNGKNMHKKRDNLQSIKHRAQIMEEKYFYILAYIGMKLITMVYLTDERCGLAGPSKGELINLV